MGFRNYGIEINFVVGEGMRVRKKSASRIKLPDAGGEVLSGCRRPFLTSSTMRPKASTSAGKGEIPYGRRLPEAHWAVEQIFGRWKQPHAFGMLYVNQSIKV